MPRAGRRARAPMLEEPEALDIPYVGPAVARALVRTSEHLVLVGGSLLALAPLYMMLITAFKTPAEFAANPASVLPPSHPTWQNFRTVWTDLDFGLEMQNSLILSLSAALIVTVASVLAGFALVRIRVPGSNWVLVLTITLMSVPAIVVIVPLFLMMVRLHQINMFPSAILVEAGLGLPFGVFMMFTFIREIPVELFRAAELEGAGYWRQLIWVAVPLSKPAILTVALVTSVFAWNDLLVPLIMWPSQEMRVLMVGLASLSPGRQGGVDVPLAMAGVTISVVPVVALFLVTRRFFVRGLVEGAIK